MQNFGGKGANQCIAAQRLETQTAMIGKVNRGMTITLVSHYPQLGRRKPNIWERRVPRERTVARDVGGGHLSDQFSACKESFTLTCVREWK